MTLEPGQVSFTTGQALGNEEDAGLEIRAALVTFRKLGAEPSVRAAEALAAGR